MTDRPNYWTRTTINRRTLLRGAVTVTGGLASLSLIGCAGRGSRQPGATNAASSATVADSTRGKQGGIFKYMESSFPPALTTVDQRYNYRVGLVHSSLLQLRAGHEGVAYDDYSLEPDVADAIPEQPDDLTYVFKLRSGVKFHNGRTVTSEDVKYSYDRYANAANSFWRTQWQNWFEHAETPDPLTVVVKTKFPYADTLQATAGNTDGYILAKEFEESPESTTKLMGCGPYLFAEAQLPISVTFKRNPDYFNKPYPYFDQVQILLTTDPVARITNFITKQVHMPWLVYAQDRDQIKQQRPDARFEEVLNYSSSGLFMRTDKPPFNDKRVRQALSMAINRKAIRDAVNKGEGHDDQFFSLMYSKVFGTSEVKDLGDAAKYWTYDVRTAKQLLSAAGIDKPIEMQMNHYGAEVIGQFFPDIATLIQAQWKEQGIANVKDNTQASALWGSTTAIGNYDGMGMAIQAGPTTGLQAGTVIRDLLYWSPNGEHSPLNVGYINDMQLSQLAQKQIGQLKADERKQTFRQMERIIAEQQYRIALSTTSQTWLWDPSLRNVQLPQDQGNHRCAMRWWFA